MIKAAEGKVERKDVSISLLDSQGSNEVMRWNLHDAWPSEWQGAALNASDRSVAIESLTLVFDRLERG
jgi:phage tail-like protein